MPELAAQLDQALAITPTEFTTAIRRLSNETFRELRVDRQRFAQALDQVRLQNGRMNEPVIQRTEVAQALGILRSDQRLANRMLRDIFTNAYGIANEGRRSALQQVAAAADEAIPAARSAADEAKVALQARQAHMIRTHYGEFRPTDLPSGNIFGGLGARQLDADMAEIMRRQQTSGFARFINNLNAVQKVFAMATDASLFTIHMLPFAYGHKKAYFRTGQAFANALVTAFKSPDLARQAHAQLLSQNRALLQRNPGLVLALSNEATEAFRQGGWFAKNAPLESNIRAVQALNPVHSAILRPIQPFQAGFDYAIYKAGIELMGALEHLATTPQARNEIWDYVNNIRGVTSSARLGVSANQRLGEAAFGLAPRYRRAVAALYFSVFQGGLRGSLARKAYLKLATGLPFTFAALSFPLGIAQGKSIDQIAEELAESLTPLRFEGGEPQLNSRFMLWRIGGQLIGPGSKYISDTRFLFKLAVQGLDAAGLADAPDSEEFRENFGVKWVRGQLALAPSFALDVLLGRDYMGEPVELTDPTDLIWEFGENIMPLWLHTTLLEGGGLLDRGSRGVTEFFGGRAFPQGSHDRIKNRSWEFLDKSWDDAEAFERDLLRELYRAETQPLQIDRVAQGDEDAKFFSRLDAIELERRQALLHGAVSGYDFWDIRNIETLARGKREEAGAGRDYENRNLDSPDPDLKALATYWSLFDPEHHPEFREDGIKGGKLKPGFDNELRLFFGSLSDSQRDYVLRNTNTRPYPLATLQKLPARMFWDIYRSQKAREKFLADTGRPHLIKPLRQMMFLVGVD